MPSMIDYERASAMPAGADARLEWLTRAKTPSVDRRILLKTALVTAALAVPSSAVAQSPQVIPKRAVSSKQTRARENAMSTAGLSKARRSEERRVGKATRGRR